MRSLTLLLCLPLLQPFVAVPRPLPQRIRVLLFSTTVTKSESCACVRGLVEQTVHLPSVQVIRSRDGLSVESQENPPKCSPANNEAGFEGTPLFLILVLGMKGFWGNSWFTCSILVTCDYLLCGRCGSVCDCSKGDRGRTGLDGLQLHSSRITLCGCTGLVFLFAPALPPWFWGE